MKYTHAACFVNGNGGLSFSHYVTEKDFPFWKGYVFLPIPDCLKTPA